MKNYKILEHTADIKVKALGKTKEELFLNAMKGMTAVLRPQVQSPKSKVQNKIKVESLDLNSLLVDFLNEVLYQGQVNKEAYNDIKFSKFSDKELEGELFGNKIELFGEDIKAATYHELEITPPRVDSRPRGEAGKNKKGLWEGTVLFDI